MWSLFCAIKSVFTKNMNEPVLQTILKYSIIDRQTLSIKINTQLYQQLKTQVAKGKIIKSGEKTLTEKLQQRNQELELTYKEIVQDKKQRRLTKEWEKAALSNFKKKE